MTNDIGEDGKINRNILHFLNLKDLRLAIKYTNPRWFNIYKEKTMSKKIEITKTALDETYKKGCSDAKRTLKNLFPDYEFEKEIELKAGQIWKNRYEGIDTYLVIGADGELCLLNLETFVVQKYSREDIEDDIKNDDDFTLCPNATIKVIEE